MLVKYKNQEYQLPDFFVVGAPKCGTTSLYQYLLANQHVFLPKVKEPQFWVYKNRKEAFYRPTTSGRRKVEENIVTNFAEYASLFMQANGKLIGDFSTHHLRYSSEFIKNIKEVYGDKVNELKIIVLTRDPIKRAYSHFSMNQRNYNEPLSFEEATTIATIKDRIEQNCIPSYDYWRFSLYREDLSRLEQTFSKVKSWEFEKLTSSTDKVLREILAFLELDLPLGEISLDKVNVSVSPPKKGLKKHLHKLVYGRSFLKGILPIALKNTLRERVRAGLSTAKPQNTNITKEGYASALVRFEEYKEQLEQRS